MLPGNNQLQQRSFSHWMNYLLRNDKFPNLEIKLMDSCTPRTQYRGTHGLVKHLTSVPKCKETMWSCREQFNRTGGHPYKKARNAHRRSIWVWLEFYLIPKRYRLKLTRLDYQLLFQKGAHASRLNSRQW